MAVSKRAPKLLPSAFRMATNLGCACCRRCFLPFSSRALDKIRGLSSHDLTLLRNSLGEVFHFSSALVPQAAFASVNLIHATTDKHRSINKLYSVKMERRPSNRHPGARRRILVPGLPLSSQRGVAQATAGTNPLGRRSCPARRLTTRHLVATMAGTRRQCRYWTFGSSFRPPAPACAASPQRLSSSRGGVAPLAEQTTMAGIGPRAVALSQHGVGLRDLVFNASRKSFAGQVALSLPQPYPHHIQTAAIARTRHSRGHCCLGPLSSTLRRPAWSPVRRLHRGLAGGRLPVGTLFAAWWSEYAASPTPHEGADRCCRTDFTLLK
jgi:hypothetical protein